MTYHRSVRRERRSDLRGDDGKMRNLVSWLVCLWVLGFAGGCAVSERVGSQKSERAG
jgi:hypothetical protein